jgi:hypothetical protein
MGDGYPPVLSHQSGVLVEQPMRFVERLGRQEQGHLSEPEFLDGAPVVRVSGSAKLR